MKCNPVFSPLFTQNGITNASSDPLIERLTYESLLKYLDEELKIESEAVHSLENCIRGLEIFADTQVVFHRKKSIVKQAVQLASKSSCPTTVTLAVEFISLLLQSYETYREFLSARLFMLILKQPLLSLLAHERLSELLSLFDPIDMQRILDVLTDVLSKLESSAQEQYLIQLKPFVKRAPRVFSRAHMLNMRQLLYTSRHSLREIVWWFHMMLHSKALKDHEFFYLVRHSLIHSDTNSVFRALVFLSGYYSRELLLDVFSLSLRSSVFEFTPSLLPWRSMTKTRLDSIEPLLVTFFERLNPAAYDFAAPVLRKFLNLQAHPSPRLTSIYFDRRLETGPSHDHCTLTSRAFSLPY